MGTISLLASLRASLSRQLRFAYSTSRKCRNSSGTEATADSAVLATTDNSFKDLPTNWRIPLRTQPERELLWKKVRSLTPITICETKTFLTCAGTDYGCHRMVTISLLNNGMPLLSCILNQLIVGTVKSES